MTAISIPKRILIGAITAAVLPAVSWGAGTIGVEGAWIRTPPPGAPTAAAYAIIVNHGPQADRLMGASTPAAAQATPHTMSMAGGVMRMREVAGGLPVPAHGALALSPEGDHLMLTGLAHPLKAGERVAITLRFAHAPARTASFVVQDAAPAQRGLGRAPM